MTRITNNIGLAADREAAEILLRSARRYMLLRALLALVGIAALAVALVWSGHASATWKGEPFNADFSAWFGQQRNAEGEFCCWESDGLAYYGGYFFQADGSVVLDIGKIKEIVPKGRVITEIPSAFRLER